MPRRRDGKRGTQTASDGARPPRSLTLTAVALGACTLAAAAAAGALFTQFSRPRSASADHALIYDEREGSRRYRLYEVGRSKAPVLVVDNLLTEPDLQRLVALGSTVGYSAGLRALLPPEQMPESLDMLPTVGELDRSRQLAWSGRAFGFPGLRSESLASVRAPAESSRHATAAGWYSQRVLSRVRAHVARGFGAGALREAGTTAFSIFCKAPHTAHLGNRCPHMDMTGDANLASVHFLAPPPNATAGGGGSSVASDDGASDRSGDDEPYAGGRAGGASGGTSFYRQRATSVEYLHPNDGAAFDEIFSCAPWPRADGAASDCALDNCIDDAKGGQMHDSNALYERLFTVPQRANRFLIYPTRVYHAAHAEPERQRELVCMAREGAAALPRLTLTAFWQTDAPLQLHGTTHRVSDFLDGVAVLPDA